MLDVNRHALIHRVLVDVGAVDHPGDGDELLTGGVRPRADPGHQQRAAQLLTAGAARHEPLGKEHPQHSHQQEQHTEFPHPAIVGP